MLQQPEPASHNPVHRYTRIIKHRIAAGFPSPAAEYTEAALDLNDYLIPDKAATFLFTVVGRSMARSGILEGDKVVVDKNKTPHHGNVVGGVINREFMSKRLLMKDGRIVSSPPASRSSQYGFKVKMSWRYSELRPAQCAKYI